MYQEQLLKMVQYIILQMLAVVLSRVNCISVNLDAICYCLCHLDPLVIYFYIFVFCNHDSQFIHFGIDM